MIRKRLRLWISVFSIVFLVILVPALEAGPVLTKVRLLNAEGSQSIPGLTWDAETAQIQIEPNGTKKVVVRGSIDRNDGVKIEITGVNGLLKWTNSDGSLGRGRFELELPVSRETTLFQFNVTPENGPIEIEQKVLLIPNLHQASLKTRRKQKKHIYTISLGTSYQTYTEIFGNTFTRTLAQSSLSIKAAYNYLLAPPTWDLGINVFTTALPLVSYTTGISTSNLTMRTIGANVRIGYSIPFIKEPWKLSLLAGWYYTTTLANGTLGYQNLMGPQIFPTVRRILKSGDAVFVYFKYAPITSNGLFRFLGPESREIATGFGWVHPLKGGTPISITFDYANLGFILPTSVSTTDAGIVSTTATFQSYFYSLSLGIGL